MVHLVCTGGSAVGSCRIKRRAASHTATGCDSSQRQLFLFLHLHFLQILQRATLLDTESKSNIVTANAEQSEHHDRNSTSQIRSRQSPVGSLPTTTSSLLASILVCSRRLLTTPGNPPFSRDRLLATGPIAPDPVACSERLQAPLPVSNSQQTGSNPHF